MDRQIHDIKLMGLNKIRSLLYTF